MEFIRRAANWINYITGRSDLYPYYAFGFEILVGQELNQRADELYIQGVRCLLDNSRIAILDKNTTLLCFYSVNRNRRDGIIHNGNFLETNERYILCNSGKYYTLSMAEINIKVVGMTNETVFGEEIFSGDKAYHIVKISFQHSIHILNHACNSFMYGYTATDNIFIDLETLEPIPATEYLFSNTQILDYARSREDVFIINNRTYNLDPKYNHLAADDVLYIRFIGLHLCGEIYVAVYFVNLKSMPIQLYPVNMRTKAAMRETLE